MSNEQKTIIAKVEKDNHVNIYEQINGQTRNIYPVPGGSNATQANVQGSEVIVYKKDGSIFAFDTITKRIRKVM